MTRMRDAKRARPTDRPGTAIRLMSDILRSLGMAPRRQPAHRPRDFQRTKVYRWERAHVHTMLDARPMPLAQCRDLVLAVFTWHEKPGHSKSWSPPLVTDGRGRRHACGSRTVIKLPRWARHPTIVLHECAHGIAADAHGPEFVACYIGLLERFAGMDRAELHRSALAAGLKVGK